MTKFSKAIPGIFLAVAFVIFMIFKFRKESNEDLNNLKQLYSQYVAIDKSDSLNHIVHQNYHPEKLVNSSRAVFLEMESGEKCRIFAQSNNAYHEDLDGIDNVIESGDRIFKRPGSDTLYIQKKNLQEGFQYYFIIRPWN